MVRVPISVSRSCFIVHNGPRLKQTQLLCVISTICGQSGLVWFAVVKCAFGQGFFHANAALWQQASKLVALHFAVAMEASLSLHLT